MPRTRIDDQTAQELVNELDRHYPQPAAAGSTACACGHSTYPCPERRQASAELFGEQSG